MLCLLGPPAVRAEDTTRPLKLRPKAVAVLAQLALERSVSRATLADLIFGEAADPRAALRWHFTYLRAHLPEPVRGYLEVTADHAAFAGPTDIEVFRRGARRLVESPDAANAFELLDLYRGDLCDGLTVSASPVFDTWLYVQQESLRREFRQATVAVAQHALGTANAERVVEPLARLIAVDPYYEDAYRLLIEANEAAGRHNAALAVYQRYQRVLRQELQTEPLRTLAERYEPGAAGERTAANDTLVSLRQLTLHVVDWSGAPPTIVAIHGSTMSAYTFTALAERLAPEFRFVAADLRGHGFSDKPPTGYTVDDHVNDLRELLAVLRIRRPVVLGFSMGGPLAARLAARTNCAALVLLDGVVGDRAFTENAAALVMPGQRATLELRVGGFDEYLAQWRRNIIASGFSDDGERILERTIRYELAPLPNGTYRRRTLSAAFEQTWASVMQTDSLADLRRVQCPTLIVQTKQPWIGGRPYLTNEIIAAQQAAAPQLTVVHRTALHPPHAGPRPRARPGRSATELSAISPRMNDSVRWRSGEHRPSDRFRSGRRAWPLLASTVDIREVRYETACSHDWSAGPPPAHAVRRARVNNATLNNSLAAPTVTLAALSRPVALEQPFSAPESRKHPTQ